MIGWGDQLGWANKEARRKARARARRKWRKRQQRPWSSNPAVVQQHYPSQRRPER